MHRSFVVADAYYFFDKSACPNGVTNASTAGCTPETLLTSSNTYSLNKVCFTADSPPTH